MEPFRDLSTGLIKRVYLLGNHLSKSKTSLLKYTLVGG